MAAEAAALIPLLDALQAAELAGADALERWIASCREPRLRGGLRVICARDRATPPSPRRGCARSAACPRRRAGPELLEVCGVVADPACPDRAKLALLLARLAGGVEGTLERAVRTSEVDAETHGLLAAIGEDDLASFRWLCAVHDGLDGR